MINVIENFPVLFNTKDKIKELRAYILSLAVQGKLVPQDPKDEPASELLKRIESEKKRLVKEKKIKKTDAMPSINDDEIPFELPNGWAWVRLGDIFQVNPTNKAEDNVEASFIPMKLIKDGFINKHSWEQRKWGEIRKGFTHLSEDDIGIAKITPCFENRKSVVFKNLINGVGAGTTELHILRKFTEDTLPEYFLLTAKSQTFIDSGIRTYTGTAGQQRIGKPYVESFILGLPPATEQPRIVQKVDELMAMCDELEKTLEKKAHSRELASKSLANMVQKSATPEDLKANLELLVGMFKEVYSTKENIKDLKDIVLQLAIQGKLVPQDPNDEPASELLKRIEAEKKRLVKEKKIKKSDKLPPITPDEAPFELPKGWVWVRLGELTHFIDYRGKTPTKTASGIPLITAKNIKYGYINENPQEFISESDYHDWMTRGIPNYGDVIFTTEAPLGNVAQLLIRYKFALAQRAIVFQTFEKTYKRAFLKYVLMNNLIRESIFKRATGTTAQGIKASKLKEIVIPVPPIAEQHRIVQKVDELMALCDNLEKNVKESARHSETLLKAVMRAAG